MGSAHEVPEDKAAFPASDIRVAKLITFRLSSAEANGDCSIITEGDARFGLHPGVSAGRMLFGYANPFLL